MRRIRFKKSWWRHYDSWPRKRSRVHSGCEEAIEEIFILAAKIGVGNVKIIITPYNLPGNGKVKTENVPMCYPKLLEEIKNELKKIFAQGIT